MCISVGRRFAVDRVALSSRLTRRVQAQSAACSLEPTITTRTMLTYVVAERIVLTDRTEVPLFLKEHDRQLHHATTARVFASARDRQELTCRDWMSMFPKLKATAESIGTPPLEREGTIAKGSTGRGYVVHLQHSAECLGQAKISRGHASIFAITKTSSRSQSRANLRRRHPERK